MMNVGSGSGLDEHTPLVSSEVRSQWRESKHHVFSNSGSEGGQLCNAAEQLFPPKRYFDAALALMRAGGLHVIADVDGKAGAMLLRVITGTALCTTGNVLASGVPVEAGVFRNAVGILTNVEAYMPNLTVEENINFVVSMRTKVTGEAREMLVEAACVLTELDRHKTAKLLSPSEAFRLRLAMEIIRDPPVIVVYYPFYHLSPADVSECCVVLKRLTTALQKTVIISCTTLPSYLFGVTDTLLLFGRGGRVLYSGEAATMPLYFNGLNVSSSVSGTRYGSVSQGVSPDYSGFSVSNRVTVSTSPPREGQHNEDGIQHFSSSPSVRMQESKTAANDFLVSCGDDAIDLATLWAESVTITEFYSSKYDNSLLRRRLFQSITRCSSPPPHISETTPFTSTAPPQYAMLKPFILCWYDAMQIWRDFDFHVHLASLSLGFLVILLLIHKQLDDQGGMYNIRGIYFVLFLLTMLANTTTMGDVDHQLRLFFYQRNNGLYGTACFMIVYVLRTVFVPVVYLALFIPLVMYVLRMNYAFFFLVGALSVSQVLLHATVHAFVPHKRWALLILRLYLGYSAIFCGFLLNLTTMPSVVGKMSILRWGYGAALAQSLRDMPFSCDGAGNTSYCYSGNSYLALEGFLDESTANSLTIFGVMCGVLTILMGVALASRK